MVIERGIAKQCLRLRLKNKRTVIINIETIIINIETLIR